MTNLTRPNRRLVVTGALAAALGQDVDARGQALSPTPQCSDSPTLRQTEGPFYKPRSPERADLFEPGMRGQEIELAGLVLTRSCTPVARAIVDLWQADSVGEYDNTGFRLRGHVLTDAEGRYRFRTIVPNAYPGRTRHFHVKVAPPVGRLLTTQLYFPGEAGNRTDPLFRPELVIRTAKNQGALAGRFDFVLDRT
jgi:protocatechuate 3,4-dioxygenase beta subunit